MKTNVYQAQHSFGPGSKHTLPYLTLPSSSREVSPILTDEESKAQRRHQPNSAQLVGSSTAKHMTQVFLAALTLDPHPDPNRRLGGKEDACLKSRLVQSSWMQRTLLIWQVKGKDPGVRSIKESAGVTVKLN